MRLNLHQVIDYSLANNQIQKPTWNWGNFWAQRIFLDNNITRFWRISSRIFYHHLESQTGSLLLLQTITFIEIISEAIKEIRMHCWTICFQPFSFHDNSGRVSKHRRWWLVTLRRSLELHKGSMISTLRILRTFTSSCRRFHCRLTWSAATVVPGPKYIWMAKVQHREIRKYMIPRSSK